MKDNALIQYIIACSFVNRFELFQNELGYNLRRLNSITRPILKFAVYAMRISFEHNFRKRTFYFFKFLK